MENLRIYIEFIYDLGTIKYSGAREEMGTAEFPLISFNSKHHVNSLSSAEIKIGATDELVHFPSTHGKKYVRLLSEEIVEDQNVGGDNLTTIFFGQIKDIKITLGSEDIGNIIEINAVSSFALLYNMRLNLRSRETTKIQRLFDDLIDMCEIPTKFIVDEDLNAESFVIKGMSVTSIATSLAAQEGLVMRQDNNDDILLHTLKKEFEKIESSRIISAKDVKSFTAHYDYKEDS